MQLNTPIHMPMSWPLSVFCHALAITASIGGCLSVLGAQPALESNTRIRAHTLPGVVYEGRVPAGSFAGGSLADTVWIEVKESRGFAVIRQPTSQGLPIPTRQVTALYRGRERGRNWYVGWIAGGAILGGTAGALTGSTTPATVSSSSRVGAVLLMASFGALGGAVTAYLSRVSWEPIWRRGE